MDREIDSRQRNSICFCFFFLLVFRTPQKTMPLFFKHSPIKKIPFQRVDKKNYYLVIKCLAKKKNYLVIKNCLLKILQHHHFVLIIFYLPCHHNPGCNLDFLFEYT